ncbi:MAG: hypothetical protein OCD76_00130 [Reichenbachiella sp.]
MKRLLYLIILFSNIALAQTNQEIQLANEYYIQGDYEKARGIYEQLINNKKNIPGIHNNYFNLLLSTNDYKSAEKYIRRAQKYYPTNIYYKIDEGIVYSASGNEEAADEKFIEVIESISDNQFLTRTAAQYFTNRQQTAYALKTYQIGRKASNDPTLFSLELANTFRLLDQKENMINEYLVFASLRPNNLRYVKNILQSILQNPDDIELFQMILIEKIQKNPDSIQNAELLIWAYMQQNDFNGAYRQAVALVKRHGEDPSRIMSIARIAKSNESYLEAEEIYQYIVDNFAQSRFYSLARNEIIDVKSIMVKSEYPIDTNSVRDLTFRYQDLIEEVGINNQTIEAYRSKALLHAFYLDEKDSAILILNEIIATPRISKNLTAESKLDLGDIYLLADEPWESTLLYSQVEKDMQSSRIGYEAKLKNAKLSYYLGNFELAKSHLDVLKTSTTKEIANDALSLSLLITNNTAFDTSDFVMKEFAFIELLQFQNKIDAALVSYQEMLVNYPDHSIVQYIYWRLANLNVDIGGYENALLYLSLIEEKYATDLYGDDAAYLKAKIYEDKLDPTYAMELYKAFIIQYPGSIYVAEARKSFRRLRGDSAFQ